MKKLNIKKALIAAGSILLFAGACKEVKGLLTIDETITLKGNEERQSFEPGSYDVELDIGQRRVALKFNSSDDRSENSKYRFYYPDDFDMPDAGETAFISSKDSKQPYDLRIAVDEEVFRSDIRHDYESCTYTRNVRRCHYRHGRPMCRWETETAYGRRYVEFVLKTTDTYYTAMLSHPNTTETVASFEGNEQDYKREYVYVDHCR